MTTDDAAKELAQAAELFELAGCDPLAAADEFDRLADKMREVASALRSEAGRQRSEQDDFVFTSGFGDRVRMAVIGPDGGVKSYIDTRNGD